MVYVAVLAIMVLLLWQLSGQGGCFMQIERNRVVTIDFTMYGEEGEVLETSKDDAPLTYMHGIGELPEGLEDELDGKVAGDEVDITLEPEDAYGEYDESLVQAV